MDVRASTRRTMPVCGPQKRCVIRSRRLPASTIAVGTDARFSGASHGAAGTILMIKIERPNGIFCETRRASSRVYDFVPSSAVLLNHE